MKDLFNSLVIFLFIVLAVSTGEMFIAALGLVVMASNIAVGLKDQSDIHS